MTQITIDRAVLEQALPCPFCGHTGLEFKEGSTFRWIIAECGGCRATRGETRIQTFGEGAKEEWMADAQDDAIKDWNRRATPPTDRALVEQLVGALEDVFEQYKNHVGFMNMAKVRAALTAGRAALTAGREALAAVDAKLAQAGVQTQGEDNTLGEIIGCFDAAIAEGLYEAIAETTDDHLKDLLERRVMHAYYKAIGPTHPQASEPALSTEDQCFCDANNLGVRGVSCGDCPRDYKQEPAPSKAGELPPFNDPRVQIAYKILVDDERPPEGEHWEGFLARKIVAALLEAQPKREPLTDGFLQPNDYYLLHRFIETTEDDESYDITKAEIKRLADLGVVQSHGFGKYSVTMFGYWVHERYWEQNPSLPLKTNTDRATEAAHKIGDQG